MAKKRVNKPNDQTNSEESQSEKSEEFLRFEEGLRKIFSLSPEEARRIREKYPANGGGEEKGN